MWQPMVCVSQVSHSCPTLCNPVDCSPPGSSIHGILQARILEWVAISFSRGSSQPRDRTQVSCTAGRTFNLRATREALGMYSLWKAVQLLTHYVTMECCDSWAKGNYYAEQLGMEALDLWKWVLNVPKTRRQWLPLYRMEVGNSTGSG